MYKYKTQISFDQCDPAGIIFYGRTFELAHRAFERLVVEAGIKWDDWFASDVFAVPIVHGEVDYFSPLRPGHEIEVICAVDKIGESSVAFAYRIEREGELAAKLKTVHVFMNIADQTKMEIPEGIRAKLKGV